MENLGCLFYLLLGLFKLLAIQFSAVAVMMSITFAIRWAINNMEISLVITAIFIIVVLVINKRQNAKLEKERLEAEARARQEEQQKAREKQLREEQLRNSVKYNKLCELFEALKPYREPIILHLNTSAEFNKYNKMTALRVAYDEIFSKYKFLNDNHFLDKFEDILILPYSFSDYVKEKEEALAKSIAHTIQTSVKVIWTYSSPAGRNYYEDSAYITFEELQEYEQNRKLYDPDDSEKARRERERQKMTLRLRHDILKRDHYRCQICGRSAQDGVTLEVDHKKPIAKGGKTEPDNLWTLCRDCNRGKGAEYDYDEDDDW